MVSPKTLKLDVDILHENNCVVFVIPFTSNLYCGLLVPIPKLPLASILILSFPLVLKIKLLAPVAVIFKFPAFVNVGVDTDVEPVIVVPDTVPTVIFGVPVNPLAVEALPDNDPENVVALIVPVPALILLLFVDIEPVEAIVNLSKLFVANDNDVFS